MPTIETCFNCFGTHSSDAKNKKTTMKPAKFKIYATYLNIPSPPLLGKWDFPRWRKSLKENIFKIDNLPIQLELTIYEENKTAKIF